MTTASQSGDNDELLKGDATDEPSSETEVPDEPSSSQRPDTEGIVVEIEDDEDVEPGLDRVAELEAQVKENYERLVRTTADFENFRKRSRREVSDARLAEQSRVLREMLPVIDNLERAITAAVGESAEVISLRHGIELVHRQFVGALERMNVARVEAEGKPFDPNLHEAVSQIESAEHAPGTVVSVLQPGYTIGEKLLRAALTVVAKAVSEPEPASDPEPANEQAESDAPSDDADGDGGARGADADDSEAPESQGE